MGSTLDHPVNYPLVSNLPKFRILYVGPLVPHENVLHRYWALQRLGQTMFPLDELYFKAAGGPLALKLRFRTQWGAAVREYNEMVYEQAIANRVDVVWADKQTFLRPATLRMLRHHKISTVDWTLDNAFGPRNDPGWRTYKSAIGEYDLHVLQRDVSLRDYTRAGARNVAKMQTVFDRVSHYPPPAGWSDKDRDREVSFVGSPYDERPKFFTRLYTEFKAPLVISGMNRWAKLLPPEAAHIYSGSELLASEYRRAIWRSKINLSFVTHTNLDEFALKTFEIAGCAGFQIAERCPGHQERFVEDEEIVLFSSVEECAEKIAHYLPDEAARTRIAWAGYRRAVESGYDNDTQLARILLTLSGLQSKEDGHPK
jgi:hypothetical protein